MAYQLTIQQLAHHQVQGHIDNTPLAWFRKILEIPRSVESWQEEGKVIDGLPQGEERALSMRRMQCAATDHKILWFQRHVYPNYELIGIVIDAKIFEKAGGPV